MKRLFSNCIFFKRSFISKRTQSVVTTTNSDLKISSKQENQTKSSSSTVSLDQFKMTTTSTKQQQQKEEEGQKYVVDDLKKSSSSTAIDTTVRLTKLREEMKKSNIQAYIVPSEDAHQSEYIAACDARRAFISGFTGSAGLSVITMDQAALWTDGRYFLQASQQLDKNWILMKSGLPEVPSKEEWLLKVLPEKSSVGIDAQLITVGAAKQLQEALKKKDHVLVHVEENLVDIVRGNDRPARPANPVHALGKEYTGKTFQEKLEDLRTKITTKNYTGFVISALDEIAWFFNLRGSDIPYNPVFFSYALITLADVTLYIEASKVTEEAKEQFGDIVKIQPYEGIFNHLKTMFENEHVSESKKIWLDARCSWALEQALGGHKHVILTRSPIMDAKAIKTETELEGFRQSHIRDAAALVSYFAWLENEININKNTSISEVDAAVKLEEFRGKQKDFVGLSFDTISSTGPNGAIIHYKPEKETCSMIRGDQIYLCDSGGQYKDGTTDVTRTLHFGTPTEFEKNAFTRVLKGHIQLDLAVFPRGTTGFLLDVLARASLWRAGLDYRHGTGHGVGHYLNVHEGPQGIGTRIGYNDIPLDAGMTVTNEPGYYQDGEFGIRIENVLLIRPAETPHNFGGKGYLGFEHVTVAPIQTKLIEQSLLTPEEKQWLNDYHQECWDKVSPMLEMGSLAYNYLFKETRPI